MRESRVHCGTCHRKTDLANGVLVDHYRKAGRQGGHCSGSGQPLAQTARAA